MRSFGDPLQPEEWGTSGIGLAAVKNYQRNSWITLEPFQMLGMTHFNAPIQYASCTYRPPPRTPPHRPLTPASHVQRLRASR